MATTRMRFMQSCIRSNGRIFARTHLFRHAFTRREYTTGKSKRSKVYEEALWAAGSIAITIPSCWFLLSSREVHQSHHKDHHDSQEHSDDTSNNHAEENNTEESEGLSVESTEKNEEVSFESDDKQKDSHDSNRSNATSECTSCKGSTEDIDCKALSSEPAEDQYDRQDDPSSSDAGKPVDVSSKKDISNEAE
ncbi:hypothetical protein OnM2_055024 [Erysiphe neolycopersici]|uniref:Uncharacterized protein n=1 Tax=Erysiphe neolycopersici TaxID=212602 RepID=A0A420HR75_9PEZI|nr:hypothetical protein OnM2_055024 [Erysiphe neolycopersici]